MNLYQINQAINDILERGFAVDEETGEVFDGEAALAELQLSKEEKLENIALYIKNLSRLSDDIKAEEEALKARRKKTDEKADRLRDYLAYQLLLDGKNGFETGKVQVKVSKSETVHIDDKDRIAPEYMKEKVTVTTEPDKLAIKAAIKEGKTVEGAYIVGHRKAVVK